MLTTTSPTTGFGTTIGSDWFPVRRSGRPIQLFTAGDRKREFRQTIIHSRRVLSLNLAANGKPP